MDIVPRGLISNAHWLHISFLCHDSLGRFNVKTDQGLNLRFSFDKRIFEKIAKNSGKKFGNSRNLFLLQVLHFCLQPKIIGTSMSSITTLSPFRAESNTDIDKNERISSDIRSFVLTLEKLPKSDKHRNSVREKIWLTNILPFLAKESCPWVADQATERAQTRIEVDSEVEMGDEFCRGEKHQVLEPAKEFSSTLNILGEPNSHPSSTWERMSITGGVEFGKIYVEFTLRALGRREEVEENRIKREQLSSGLRCKLARKNKELEEETKGRDMDQRRGFVVAFGSPQRRGRGRNPIKTIGY